MKRQLYVAVLLTAVFAGTLSGTPAHANEETKIIQAQGNPYLVDFQAISNKRANLRSNVVRQGLDSAFSEWLRYEHPFAYHQISTAKATDNTESDTSALRSSGHPYLVDFISSGQLIRTFNFSEFICNIPVLDQFDIEFIPCLFYLTAGNFLRPVIGDSGSKNSDLTFRKMMLAGLVHVICSDDHDLSQVSMVQFHFHRSTDQYYMAPCCRNASAMAYPISPEE